MSLLCILFCLSLAQRAREPVLVLASMGGNSDVWICSREGGERGRGTGWRRGVTQRGEDSTITAMSTYTGSHNTHISDREAEPKKKEKMVACEML